MYPIPGTIEQKIDKTTSPKQEYELGLLQPLGSQGQADWDEILFSAVDYRTATSGIFDWLLKIKSKDEHSKQQQSVSPRFTRTYRLLLFNQFTYQLLAVLGSLLFTLAFSAAVISDQSL